MTASAAILLGCIALYVPMYALAERDIDRPENRKHQIHHHHHQRKAHEQDVQQYKYGLPGHSNDRLSAYKKARYSYTFKQSEHIPEMFWQLTRGDCMPVPRQLPKYFLHELDLNGGINGGQGYSHQVHAIACAMQEAKVLGRVLVLPKDLVLQPDHTFGQAMITRPIDEVLNVDLLRSYVPINLVATPQDYGRWLVQNEQRLMLTVPVSVTTEDLQALTNVDVIMRPHQHKYAGWFEPCIQSSSKEAGDRWLAEAPKLLPLFRPADNIVAVSQQVQQRLGAEYCALHVRRGDKLYLIEGLDAATQPAAILESIREKCHPGRTLYIGTNEQDPNFFDPLKEHYDVKTWRDFTDVLEAANMAHDQGNGYMITDNWGTYAVEVDVMLAGKPFMDTFCVLFKTGDHQGCDVEGMKGNNAGMYGIGGLGLLNG